MSSPLDRYRLIEHLIVPDQSSAYWRGYDLTLDREVLIRTLVAADPRAAALREAARSSAMIEDRRLIRVLDVIEVPATQTQPALIAVINEWVQGHTLAQIMESRQWQPLDVDQAVGIVWEVAQALHRAHDLRIRHGRLMPTSVVMTDAAEVRIVGMSIDAVLLGAPHEDLIRSDVDALGGLLYFLLTGKSPFFATTVSTPDDPDEIPAAPRHGDYLASASDVRADVPGPLDVLIGRSMIEMKRPRGTAKIRNVDEFLTELTKIRDHVDPVAIARDSNVFISWGLRAVIGLAIVAGIGISVVAYRQLFVGTGTEQRQAAVAATPTPSPSFSLSTLPAQILPITSIISFDPFGDDNGDGNTDGISGRERDALAKNAVDASKTTSWKSAKYNSADADGKGGVGLVLNLGSPQSIASITVKFGEVGAPIRASVANTMAANPDQWTNVANAPAGKNRVTLRSPRVVTGQYVLLWFPKLPPSVQNPDKHQVRVSNVIVRGQQ